MIPFLVATLVVALAGAALDYKTGQIPNWLTLGALPLGPLAHFGVWLAQGHPLGDSLYWMAWALAGAAVCAGPAAVLWRGGAIGGGDVKLLAALGGFCGPRRAMDIVSCAFVGFIVLAAVALARRGRLASTLKNAWLLAKNRFTPAERRVPTHVEAMTELRMGPAILAGVVAAFVWEYLWWGRF